MLLSAQEGREVSPVPVDTSVSPEIQSRVRKALEELVESVALLPDRRRDDPPVQYSQEPKTWFADPFAILDHMGMGYRAVPSILTFETLRVMAERSPLCASIINTRITQVVSFCVPQRDQYSIGYKIQPKSLRHNPHRLLTHSEEDRVQELDQFLQYTGVDQNRGRDSFETFIKKLVRDRLTYDQVGFEVVRTRGGWPHSFLIGDGATFRIAEPKVTKNTPPDLADLKRQIGYCQIINGQKVAEYTHDELAFIVANPRSNIRVYGYGFPELEMGMKTITSHLFAEEWNHRAFSQGSTMKGALNLQGNIGRDKFEAFKRDFLAQISGVVNAWKMPIMNAEGLQFIPMQNTNQEMGYEGWMNYLIKIFCALYLIDPAEINFDLRGAVGGQQPMFMSSNEAAQKVSKDRGLQPLLRLVQGAINRYLIESYDPRFEFLFVGLDAQTETQVADLRQKQVSTIMTVDEGRALQGLPPLGKARGGDVVANPALLTYVQQMQMQQQQQQQMGGAGGGMPPGGGQQPQLPPGGDESQPYQNAFRQPPGREEQQGAAAVEAMDKKQQKLTHDPQSAGVHFNDWQSSVHSSLPAGDLQKALPVFDTIALE